MFSKPSSKRLAVAQSKAWYVYVRPYSSASGFVFNSVLFKSVILRNNVREAFKFAIKSHYVQECSTSAKLWFSELKRYYFARISGVINEGGGRQVLGFLFWLEKNRLPESHISIAGFDCGIWNGNYLQIVRIIFHSP